MNPLEQGQQPLIKVARSDIGKDELAAIQQVFDEGWLGMGSHTLRFEEALAEFLGAKNVVALNTGTSALHLALDALNIGPGDEVLVPSLTYVASFQAVTATGATPVACDVDPDTLLLDLDDAESRITDRTKAVMPVHYCGQPVDLKRLLEWRDARGIRVVEDAAHAIGSTYQGRLIGSFGDVTCFSFDPIKVMTCGEGGALVTTDDSLAGIARNSRLLGVDRESEYRYRNERKWFYDVNLRGYRYHMSNINAAIGLTQLPKLPRFIERRRQICRAYVTAFDGISSVRLLDIDYAEAAPFMFVVRVPAEVRERFMAHLKSVGVETGIHYLPNHWHSLYRQAGGSLPVSDRVGEEIVTLPLHSRLSDEDVGRVVDGVTSFFQEDAS